MSELTPGEDTAIWPETALTELSRLQAEIDVAQVAVKALVGVIREDGVTWDQISDALRVSKSVVHYRYALRKHEDF